MNGLVGQLSEAAIPTAQSDCSLHARRWRSASKQQLELSNGYTPWSFRARPMIAESGLTGTGRRACAESKSNFLRETMEYPLTNTWFGAFCWLNPVIRFVVTEFITPSAMLAAKVLESDKKQENRRWEFDDEIWKESAQTPLFVSLIYDNFESGKFRST